MTCEYTENGDDVINMVYDGVNREYISCVLTAVEIYTCTSLILS